MLYWAAKQYRTCLNEQKFYNASSKVWRRSHFIKHNPTRCPKRMFGHQTMFDPVWSTLTNTSWMFNAQQCWIYFVDNIEEISGRHLKVTQDGLQWWGWKRICLDNRIKTTRVYREDRAFQNGCHEIEAYENKSGQSWQTCKTPWTNQILGEKHAISAKRGKLVMTSFQFAVALLNFCKRFKI